jgi:hypothetical protein
MGRLAEDRYTGLKARLKAEENTLTDRCASMWWWCVSYMQLLVVIWNRV